MTKIVFNYSGLKSRVIPNLEDSINHLEKAVGLSSNLNIPSDFRYSSYLHELKTNLNRHKKEIIDVKNWLESTNTKLENTLYDVDSELQKIQKPVITKRENIVNKF